MVAVVAALLAVASFVQAWRVTCDDDKDLAQYYAPPSLDRLIAGAIPAPSPAATTARSPAD